MVRRRRHRRAAAEQVEGTVEPVVEVGEAERRQPPGGQLDGERHPVEAAHDLGDQAQVVRTGREVGLDATGAVDEHGDRW